MKFSLALVALLPLFVRAADIPVAVGQSGLTFEPSSVTAAEGDVIVFSFYPKNHTVTQSSFNTPCTTLVDDDAADPDGDDDGVADSGFIPVTDASTPTVWNYTVTSDDPLWFYCAQTSPVNHCTGGMVFAINPTADRTFEAFQANARNAGSSTTTGTGASPTNTSPGQSSSTGTGTTQTGQPTGTGAAGGNGAMSVASSGAASFLALAGAIAAFAL